MRRLLPALLLLLPLDARAASNAGTSTAEFLELGSGARAAGMGEAAIAAATDATAVRYNPAAMTRVEENSASFMHAVHLQGAALDHLAYVRRLDPESAAGLSLLYMDYGSIQKTDEFAAPVGTAKPSDLAFTAAYAHQFGGHSVGLSLSYIQSKIVKSAQTAAATVGFLSRPYGPRRIRAALVVENLGGTMKFDKKADPLPLTIRAGAAGALAPGLLATAELVSPRDAGLYGAAGLEKWFGSPYDRGLALRAGYNTRSLGDVSGLTGISLGLGFALNTLMLDYAFVPFGDLGWTHRVSLSMRFGSEESESRAAVPPMEEAAKLSAAQAPAVSTAPAVPAGPPSPPPVDYAKEVYALERLGARYVKEKDLQEAKAEYIRAIMLAKEHDVHDAHVVNAYLGLAWCLSVQGQIPAAIKNYEKARQLTENEDTQKRIDAKLAELRTHK